MLTAYRLPLAKKEGRSCDYAFLNFTPWHRAQGARYRENRLNRKRSLLLQNVVILSLITAACKLPAGRASLDFHYKLVLLAYIVPCNTY